MIYLELFLSFLKIGVFCIGGGYAAMPLIDIGGKKEEIKVIGIRHGEKMYETLLTNEECANAIDMGNYYRVPCDKRGLNYDKYFNKGEDRTTLTAFNSNNTKLLNKEEVKAKLLTLTYIQERLAEEK